MNSVYKKSVPEGVLDAPASSPYLKATPKGELKSLRNIVAQGNFSNSDHSVFTWALDDTGLLTIDGKGDMPVWKGDHLEDRPWDSAQDGILSVQIANGVTRIGDYTFKYCTNLQKISIPESLKSIGDVAFGYCTSLREIHIPDSVTSIGCWAFEGCTSLSKIHIPDNAASIKRSAFINCTSLREIYIPSSVAELEVGVFWGCTGLTHVTMPARFDRLLFKFYYGIPKSIVTFY